MTRCPKDQAATVKLERQGGAHPLAGTFLGSYRVERVIGAGGMGEVLLGEHPTLEKKVAIKILRNEVSYDPELVERFFAEAKAIAKLQHPNIVEVLDLSVMPNGCAYYVMEHLEGQSLARAMSRQKRIPPAQAVPIFSELLDALAVAHRGGIVHRDIKPANIFLLKTPKNGAHVKLLDFGVAKLLDPKPNQPNFSLPGVVLGTPAYMSPEQAVGRGVGPSSDLYAVGVVLFEALVGDLPFGETEDEVAQMEARVRSRAPRISSVLPEMKPLDEFIACALEKDPNKRFASAEKMREALLVVARSQSWDKQAAPEPAREAEQHPTTKRQARAIGEHAPLFDEQSGKAPAPLPVAEPTGLDIQEPQRATFGLSALSSEAPGVVMTKRVAPLSPPKEESAARTKKTRARWLVAGGASVVMIGLGVWAALGLESPAAPSPPALPNVPGAPAVSVPLDEEKPAPVPSVPVVSAPSPAVFAPPAPPSDAPSSAFAPPVPVVSADNAGTVPAPPVEPATPVDAASGGDSKKARPGAKKPAANDSFDSPAPKKGKPKPKENFD